MKIAELGEFGFIDKIAAGQQDINLKNAVGIGDDCAVIPSRKGYSYLITSDMLVEGKHFLSEHITPYDLGSKSLGVNLSDIAAMGGKPLYSFLSISLPPTVTTEWADDFLEGYNSFGIPLLGGDTVSADAGHLAISVTAVGECRNEHIKYRSGAKEGDYIVVTGELGSSAAGFRALGTEGWEILKREHLSPYIYIGEGEWLGERSEVTAMMDISDGVSSDIRHICRLSACGAKIEIDKLPMQEEFLRFCAQKGLNAAELALSGGEDYKLLLTVKRDYFTTLRNDYLRAFGTDLNVIGEIERAPKIRYTENGNEVHIKKGFSHF